MPNSSDRDARNEIRRSEEQVNSRYDAEKEIPDPEQVDEDIQEAERDYGMQKDRKAS